MIKINPSVFFQACWLQKCDLYQNISAYTLANQIVLDVCWTYICDTTCYRCVGHKGVIYIKLHQHIQANQIVLDLCWMYIVDIICSRCVGHKGVIYISLILYATRFIIYAAVSNPSYILIAEIFRGMLSYGVLHFNFNSQNLELYLHRPWRLWGKTTHWPVK